MQDFVTACTSVFVSTQVQLLIVHMCGLSPQLAVLCSWISNLPCSVIGHHEGKDSYGVEERRTGKIIIILYFSHLDGAFLSTLFKTHFNMSKLFLS